MDASEPQRDPMPDASASIDEIIAFGDTHSTADYEDQTEEVAFDIDLREEVFTVALVPGLVDLLEEQARARGVTIETLVNLWLAERLRVAA
ncbi:MAG: hypothetical protein C4309_01890 [Chloroflexota bacterium]